MFFVFLSPIILNVRIHSSVTNLYMIPNFKTLETITKFLSLTFEYSISKITISVFNKCFWFERKPFHRVSRINYLKQYTHLVIYVPKSSDRRNRARLGWMTSPCFKNVSSENFHRLAEQLRQMNHFGCGSASKMSCYRRCRRSCRRPTTQDVEWGQNSLPLHVMNSILSKWHAKIHLMFLA